MRSLWEAQNTRSHWRLFVFPHCRPSSFSWSIHTDISKACYMIGCVHLTGKVGWTDNGTNWIAGGTSPIESGTHSMPGGADRMVDKIGAARSRLVKRNKLSDRRFCSHSVVFLPPELPGNQFLHINFKILEMAWAQFFRILRTRFKLWFDILAKTRGAQVSRGSWRKFSFVAI